LCVEKALGIMPESSLADISFEQAVHYSVLDADATLRVKLKLEKLLQEAGLDFVFWMDTNILPMVYSMMQTGMAVDLDHFRNLSTEYDARMRAKSTELSNVVGHPFNPSSSPQVAQVIYTELGFKPTRMTPSGEVSTDDQELKKIKDATGQPIAKGIIEYRRLSKMKGTYADALVEWAIPDDEGIPRVHTTLKTTRVETGRLASADPNLQNIPTRNKEAKLIKSGFVAPDGKLLLEGDLAQIEMCIQAHLANCKGLIDLFLRGEDPHTKTASQIFGVPYEDAKQEKYRYPTKRANFGVIYMIGARGLSSQIGEYIADLEMEGEKVEVEPWSEQDCEKFINDWYALYPEVREYQMEQAAMARRYGYTVDLFGRRRFIPEVSCPIRSVQEAGLRMAANFSVTSSAQGVIKISMGELWRKLPRTGWSDKVKFLLQIHDSLLCELDDDDEFVREYVGWMRKIMCGGVKLLVPVKVDFKIGKAWGSLEKYSEENKKYGI
jgi:DNA polymerase-1